MPTLGLCMGPETDEIAASHADLVECPMVAALTTRAVPPSPVTSDPEDQRTREMGVICRIHARRVTLDAIHG
jgi:hypothetical protein